MITIEQLKEETAREFDEKFEYESEGCSECGGFQLIDLKEVRFPKGKYYCEYDLEKVKSFLLSAQQQAYNLAMERVKESLDIVWKEMTERTYKHTLEGKNSPFEVTQEDWDNSSFTIEEFKERLLSSLTTDKNIT